MRAAWNWIWVSTVVTSISVPTAFVCAYALTRTCLQTPFKATFKLIALIPLLAPSLLSAISFVQWFGNQGALKFLLGGASIYGAPGIIPARSTTPSACAMIPGHRALATAGGVKRPPAGARGRASS
jgi:iron(III) transport system permease protein